MLVLTRREGQAIMIDGGIRLVVLSVDRRGVRLGIEAPDDISVLRAELVAEIAAVNSAARESGQSLASGLGDLRLLATTALPGDEAQPHA